MHNNAEERTLSILNSHVLSNSTSITSPEVVDTTAMCLMDCRVRNRQLEIILLCWNNGFLSDSYQKIVSYQIPILSQEQGYFPSHHELSVQSLI